MTQVIDGKDLTPSGLALAAVRSESAVQER